MDRLKQVAIIAVGMSIAMCLLFAGLAVWGYGIVWSSKNNPWMTLPVIVVPIAILFALIVTSQEDPNDLW